MPPFSNVLGTVEELRALYRDPHPVIRAKVKHELDAASASFIRSAPFVLVGTRGPDGLDVSPRGGPPGFVKVLGANALADRVLRRLAGEPPHLVGRTIGR